MSHNHRTTHVGQTGVVTNVNIRRYDKPLLQRLADLMNAPDPDGWSRINILDGWPVQIGNILSRFSKAKPAWIEMQNDPSRKYGHFTRYRLIRATKAGSRAFADVGIVLTPYIPPVPTTPEPPAPEIDLISEERHAEIEAENARIIRESGLFTEIALEEFPMLRILTGELARLFPADASCGHDAELAELARLREWREKVLAG